MGAAISTSVNAMNVSKVRTGTKFRIRSHEQKITTLDVGRMTSDLKFNL